MGRRRPRARHRVDPPDPVSRGRPPRFDEPKTASSRRTLALDLEATAALRGHRARQAAERLAAGDVWHDHGLVFADEDGSPLHPNTVSRTFDRLAREASLPRITLHGIRHAYLTMLQVSDVAADASFDMVCGRCRVRGLGFSLGVAAG